MQLSGLPSVLRSLFNTILRVEIIGEDDLLLQLSEQPVPMSGVYLHSISLIRRDRDGVVEVAKVC